MSRSNYSDDCEEPALALYRGRVANAIKGERGQAFLRELVAALDAMPVKELIRGDLVRSDGACCTLGTVVVSRGYDAEKIIDRNEDEGETASAVAAALGISETMVREITYMNDEGYEYGTPAQRWTRMRRWVAENIKAKP
jgi:hypothetical protein